MIVAEIRNRPLTNILSCAILPCYRSLVFYSFHYWNFKWTAINNLHKIAYSNCIYQHLWSLVAERNTHYSRDYCSSWNFSTHPSCSTITKPVQTPYGLVNGLSISQPLVKVTVQFVYHKEYCCLIPWLKTSKNPRHCFAFCCFEWCCQKCCLGIEILITRYN